MYQRRLSALTALALAAVSGVWAAAPADEDTFPDPKKASAVQVGGVATENLKEPPHLDAAVLEKLSKEARGGKSAFPEFVAKQYEADLAKGSGTGSGLNAGILKFCAQNMGKKVGDGQCAVLLAEALKAVGGKRLPPHGLDADYVWGTLVATVQANKLGEVGKIQPGDLIQYRNATFKGTAKSGNSTYWWSYSAPHHSSVVMRTGRGGALISVYESNVNNVLTVQKGYYDFKDMTGGTIKVYRATK